MINLLILKNVSNYSIEISIPIRKIYRVNLKLIYLTNFYN